MTMKPYIFLSGNYLHLAQDENAQAVTVDNITEPVSYAQTIFFSDRYGNITNHSVDTLILQNTNIVNMTVEAADGLGNYSQIFNLQGNSENTIVLKNATPVVTSSLRFTIPDDTYNPPVITAKIGAYGFICNLCAQTDSNYKIEANEGSFRVVSGKYIHYSDYKKWVGKIKTENLPKEQFDALTAQADAGEMTVIPYTDLEAEAIYECAAKREYSWELDRKTKLFKLDLELNEL